MARPTQDELARIEREASELARTAGERALRAFRGSLTLEFKGKRHDDPVTATDRDIEEYLRAELHERFPSHAIVGEEQEDEGDPGQGFVWVLDPLDGTANFASGLPLWGVSMGLLHDGEPVVGCVWVPASHTAEPALYHARRGGGAWCDDTPLRVDLNPDERGRIIALPGRYWRAFGFRRIPGATGRRVRGADNRALGSIAVEQVLVAAGVLRLAVFVSPKIWDVGAGALIVREAGGEVVTWEDRRWQRFERFAPMPPPKPSGEPPKLRHWTRPLVVGTPAASAKAVERLAWRPRLPQRLRTILGLD